MYEIFILKKGVLHPLSKLGFIQKPFSFFLKDGTQIFVDESDTPIFFTRKRMRLSGKGNIKNQYIYRYCIGSKKPDGSEEKFWVFPDGNLDLKGEEPSEQENKWQE